MITVKRKKTIKGLVLELQCVSDTEVLEQLLQSVDPKYRVTLRQSDQRHNTLLYPDGETKKKAKEIASVIETVHGHCKNAYKMKIRDKATT